MKRHDPILVAALLAAAATPLAAASAPQEPAARATQAEPLGQRVDAVIARHEAAMQAFRAAYSQAADGAARQRVYEQQHPDADTYCVELMLLGEGAPEDPAAARALAWVARNTERPALRERASELLVEHHLESPELLEAVVAFERRSADGRAFLESVIERSGNEDVQARARYTLAANLLFRAEAAAGLQARAAEGVAVDGAPDGLAKLDPASARREAEELLDALVKDGPAVDLGRRGSLLEVAEGQLFELRHLQLGMVAPEIEGRDLDGVAFKLSDYRGKVVVLDFWGNW
jgi:hypothetical protein